LNKRKRVVVFALIIFSSFFTSLFFQNCSGGIQSQADLGSSSSSGGNNTPNSVPNPSAPPAGCTGMQPADVETVVAACPTGQTGRGTVSIVEYTCVGSAYQALPPRTVVFCTPVSATPPPPLSADEKGRICDDYISGVTPTISNSVVATSMSSGLGNGTNGTGNGDTPSGSISATIDANIRAGSQNIAPPFPGVSGARSDTELDCQYNSRVTCDVVIDGTTRITKAINKDITSANYGKDEGAMVDAMAPGQAKNDALMALANRVVSTARSGNGTTCEFDIANAISGARTQTYTLNHVRNEQGLLCVQGVIKIRMSVQTTTPNGQTSSNNSADSTYTVTVNNNCWDEDRLIPNPSSLPTTANYGAVVTASNRWIVALSQSDNGTSTQIGSVSIFDKNNLALAPVKLYLSGLAGGGSTGDGTFSASLAGDSLAVGAFNRSTYVGQVHFFVYENGSWVKKGNTLTSGGARNSFGYSVALSSTGLLAVGAPRHSNVASSGTGDLSGRVFLYGCNTGGCTYVNEIQNPNPGAYFGAALSISGNRLAVGAPYVTAQSDSHGDGFVRVFDISGTTATQVGTTILPPGLTAVSTGPSDIQITNPVDTGGVRAGRGFGSSVAVSGNRLVVGAPNKSRLNAGALIAKVGEAYYYSNFTAYVNSTSGTPAGVVILNNGGAAQDSRYGQGVSLNNKGVFTGCPYCQANMGQIYYHVYTDGASNISANMPRATFPLDRINRDGFGNSIFANDADVIVGASNRTVGASTQAGAAYRFAAP